jgi:quercetin dioxygenase-like cupin family protein
MSDQPNNGGPKREEPRDRRDGFSVDLGELGFEGLGFDGVRRDGELPRDVLDGGSALALEAAPVSPSDALRNRLLSSLAVTSRFEEYEARVARLLDLSLDGTRPLLLAIDGGAKWDRGPRQGIELFHVDGGPAVENAVTGFVRIAPGTEFPEHSHLGEEVVLVLQGACEDSGGAVFGAGDEARMAAGTHHHLRAIGEVRLLYLAVIDRGVVIDGVPVLPGDPGA